VAAGWLLRFVDFRWIADVPPNAAATTMVEIPLPPPPLAQKGLLSPILMVVPHRPRPRWQPLLLPRKISILRSRTQNGKIPRPTRLGELCTDTYLPLTSNPAQWQSWLRHSRAEPPSVQELIEDLHRRENTRRLAQIADDKWATDRTTRPAVTSGDDALKGISVTRS
jgi:hypothetical protein